MREIPTFFEIMTDFEVRKFDELVSLVCPTIHDNAHDSTCIKRVMSGKPTKLTLEQRLFNFIK